MKKNCSECDKPLHGQARELISTDYFSVTRTLTVTKSTIKKCLYCGKEQRVLPIETTARAIVKDDGSIEVIRC